jgi:hypothetical protein
MNFQIYELKSAIIELTREVDLMELNLEKESFLQTKDWSEHQRLVHANQRIIKQKQFELKQLELNHKLEELNILLSK